MSSFPTAEALVITFDQHEKVETFSNSEYLDIFLSHQQNRGFYSIILAFFYQKLHENENNSIEHPLDPPLDPPMKYVEFEIFYT